jgi:hypothetical protein
METKRAALIIILGALPASALFPFAAAGALVGILAFLSDPLDPGEWVIFALGFGGLYGVLSLWLLAFRQASKFTFYGLFAGSMSLLVMDIFWLRGVSVAELPALNLVIYGYVCVAPLVMAVALIVDIVRKRSLLG